MSSQVRAEVELQINGAEKSANQAMRALNPWRIESERAASAFKSLGHTVSDISRGIATNMSHIATAATAISLGAGIAGMLKFEDAASKLAVTSQRKFSEIKREILGMSESFGMTPQRIAKMQLDLNRQMYDLKRSGDQGTMGSMIGLGRAIGRDPEEMLQIPVALQQVGVSARDANSAMAMLLATGEKLGGMPGAAKLVDQFMTLQGLFQRTSLSMEQIVGLTANMGKGLPPEMQAKVQAGILGASTDTRRAMIWDYIGHQRGFLKKGESAFNYETGEADPIMEHKSVMGMIGGWSKFKQYLFLNQNLGLEGKEAKAYLSDDWSPKKMSGEEIANAQKQIDRMRNEYQRQTQQGRNEAAAAAGERRFIGIGSGNELRNDLQDMAAANPLTAAIAAQVTPGIMGSVTGGLVGSGIGLLGAKLFGARKKAQVAKTIVDVVRGMGGGGAAGRWIPGEVSNFAMDPAIKLGSEGYTGGFNPIHPFGLSGATMAGLGAFAGIMLNSSDTAGPEASDWTPGESITQRMDRIDLQERLGAGASEIEKMENPYGLTKRRGSGLVMTNPDGTPVALGGSEHDRMMDAIDPWTRIKSAFGIGGEFKYTPPKDGVIGGGEAQGALATTAGAGIAGDIISALVEALKQLQIYIVNETGGPISVAHSTTGES